MRDYKFPVQTDIKDLPRVEAWSSMITLLGVIADSVCDEYRAKRVDQDEKL